MVSDFLTDQFEILTSTCLPSYCKGVVNVSESQAKVFLAIIEGMIPAIEAVMRQTGMKKRDFAGLALGLVLPDSINPALIRIKSQMASLRTRALTLADSMITFSPVCSPQFADHLPGTDFDNVARNHGEGRSNQESNRGQVR